jgi:hypothetical protein
MPAAPLPVIESALRTNFADIPPEEARFEHERRHIKSALAITEALSAQEQSLTFTLRDSRRARQLTDLIASAHHIYEVRAWGAHVADAAIVTALDAPAYEALGVSIAHPQDAEIKTKFQRLSAQWQKERGISSSTTDIVLCPSYQQIIGMGDKALPLIFAQLRLEGNRPNQWFWALRSITGADPVPPEYRGRRRDMARIWLAWAAGKGF